MAELFSQPPPAFSPVPIWWWSGDALDPVRLREQMQQLIAGGVRQAVVMNLAPSGPLYGALADEPAFFSDAWWSVFEGVCRDARELGFALWFYDQLGFSGADIQGRLVQRDPSCRGRSIERLPICPQGGEVLARLPEGQLICSVPRGFDYLDPGSCSALLDQVHGEFERRVGGFFGSTIVGSFQDELPSMPSWSKDFAAQFAQRRGYDLLPVIDALWGEGDGSVRADYQRTRAELAEESFFRPLHDWHQARGLAVGCDQQHPARAGYPLESTQQYADYLRTHRWFTAPGSDHWGEAKVHSSLAHLYDRPRTWVEAFHGSGWGSTLEETYDWLLPWLRAGATLFNPHAVYYSTRGGRWEWAAPSTCWRQPYWRHYPLLAAAVSRLCAALSWGDHVCDVGVLFPTTTVQADLDLALPEALFSHGPGLSQAQDTYLDVVGRMHWYEPQPGVLDLAGRDFDVLDEDSLVRGRSEGGRLGIGRESYRAVVLPACRELAEPTVTALRDFSEHGGIVVAIGSYPAALRGCVREIPSAADLPATLSDVPLRVVAPSPTLMRSDGDSAALLVLAAHPGATVQPGGAGWRTEGYDFDPSRYARQVHVSVRGVSEPVAVWDPGAATSRSLEAVRDGDILHVDVPLDLGPCALVVFGPEAAAQLSDARDLRMAVPGAGGLQMTGLGSWTGELIPTLDNSWGDFSSPRTAGLLPVRLWRLEHLHGGQWRSTTATFGPGGEILRGDEWQPLEWSSAAGAPGTPLGDEPRGFVPEEFIDLGQVAAASSTALRFLVSCAAETTGWLSVGSTAAKQVRWNGELLTASDGPYYGNADVRVLAGTNLLELELTAPTACRLKASWVLRPRPEELPKPQWVTGRCLRRAFEVTSLPDQAELQLGTIGPVTLRLNGAVLGLHGEYDNYQEVRQPRVRRYELGAHLVVGTNVIELDLADESAAAVVDAFIDDACLVSDGSWHGVSGGLAEVPHDPRWVQLRPRPHPLPDGHVLQGLPAGEVLGTLTRDAGPGSAWFRVSLPPGTTEVSLPVAGHVTVTADGVPLAVQHGICLLDSPARAGLELIVQVDHDGSAAAGRLWSGPLVVRAEGPGEITLGDWSERGLRDWSGGVRYTTSVAGPLSQASLDLGHVRGTAEVRVNGRPAGCRIWSPYVFDVSGLVDRDVNVIEVDVYNTLAPYIAAVSPSPWVLPGQTLSGLLGPAALRTTLEER